MSDTSLLRAERVRERAYHLWEQSGRTDHAPEDFWYDAEEQIEAEERQTDKALADSFPASDPPANSGIT